MISLNMPLLEEDKSKLYPISSSTFKDEHIFRQKKHLIVTTLSISFINKYDVLRLDLPFSFIFGYEEKCLTKGFVSIILGR